MAGWELLEAAAKNRGFLAGRGEYDTERMSAVLLDEFRGGKLGRITPRAPAGGRRMSAPLWEIEDAVSDEGFARVCGVDEAGRGPLAGPVCAAAVILPRGCVIDGLNDSKQLSEKRREALYDEIVSRAERYGIAFATRRGDRAA